MTEVGGVGAGGVKNQIKPCCMSLIKPQQTTNVENIQYCEKTVGKQAVSNNQYEQRPGANHTSHRENETIPTHIPKPQIFRGGGWVFLFFKF